VSHREYAIADQRACQDALCSQAVRRPLIDCPILVMHCICFDGSNFLCAHTQTFPTSLVSRSSRHSFLIFPNRFPLLRASVAVLSFNDRLPPTTYPSFFPCIARIIDAPRLLAKHYPTIPSISPLCRTQAPIPPACSMHATEPVPFLCTLCRFSFYLTPTILDTFLSFLSIYGFHLPARRRFFFSLYGPGQTNLKNHQTKYILSLSIDNQLLFFLFILFQININDETSCSSPTDHSLA